MKPAAPPPEPTRIEEARDRSLAMTGYALSVAALFTFWLTGLVAFLIALSRRKSPDPVARAHFRFQLLVADLAGLAVGLGAALGVSALILVGAPLFDGEWPTLSDFGGAAGLVVAGVVLWAVSTLGTIVGAGYGAWRLVQGREVRIRLWPSRR